MKRRNLISGDFGCLIDAIEIELLKNPSLMNKGEEKAEFVSIILDERLRVENNWRSVQ